MDARQVSAEGGATDSIHQTRPTLSVADGDYESKLWIEIKANSISLKVFPCC